LGVRAFISLEVPDAVKDRVEAVKEGLDLPGVVFVKRSAMHITLQFLGDIGEREAGHVADAMRGIEFPPFRVGLRGLSYFSLGSPVVIYAKIEDGAGELMDLYGRLGEAISGKGLAVGRERYAPHLTVARVKSAADGKRIIDAIGRLSETDFGSFEARSVVLRKSVLTRKGPEYTDLYELEL
jgi:RNA 2',3'-cyclic 3'-phosphodiesterase